MNKKWECRVENQEEIQALAQEFHISTLLATILVNKKLVDKDMIEVFLNPRRSDFHNPFLMPDMEIAVNRIMKAMETNEKVMIYGDYDVDGITSITVLKKFLKDRGLETGSYIPNRLEEGYGLSEQAIQKIAAEKYTLMITVDCGISGIAEVELANRLGIETIITDHHEPAEVLPKALAVVDAKRKDNQYPFNQLAGVGVVFKLIQAIGMKMGLQEKEYLQYLDIVCIGTISDIVPLIDENRVIAKLGLRLVEMSRNIGIKAMIETIGYKTIDSTAISFGIAPRINACGRMGHEKEALQLFLTDSLEEARNITQKLNRYNLERQEKEKAIFKQAVEKIEQEEQGKKAIILGSDNWHHGVIGIVASKVTEMYFKPSILICFEGEEGKGSGRSVPGFDLHEALTKCSNYITKFGGHAMAVGITVSREAFPYFKKDVEDYLERTNVGEFIPVIQIDKEVTLKDISFQSVHELKMLEPFGEANKTPIFLYRNLKIHSIRALSEGKHLKLTLKDEHFYMDAMGFNMGSYVEEYRIGDKIDVVGTLEINTYNGNQSIQMNLKDIRASV